MELGCVSTHPATLPVGKLSAISPALSPGQLSCLLSRETIQKTKPGSQRKNDADARPPHLGNSVYCTAVCCPVNHWMVLSGEITLVSPSGSKSKLMGKWVKDKGLKWGPVEITLHAPFPVNLHTPTSNHILSAENFLLPFLGLSPEQPAPDLT